MIRIDRVLVFSAAVGLTVGLIAAATASGQIGLAAGGAGALAAYGAGCWLLRPLQRYVEHIQRLAAGEFDEEAPSAKDPRFVELTGALEAMRLHLRTWMSQIARSAIEFEGSLQVLDLLHVMHFLRAGKRSGTLVLQRGGETALQFWEGGEVVGALCGGAAGLDALKAPFRWERGSFKFSPRLHPTVNLNARWEVLLLDAVRDVDNPKLWARLVPKTTTAVRRSALAAHMPVRHLLTGEEWTLWSALTDELSAEDMGERLGESVHKAWHALYCFRALGLIESVEDGATLPTPTRIGDGGLSRGDADGPRPTPIASVDPRRDRAGIQIGTTRPVPPGPAARKASGDNVISLDAARRRGR